MEQKTFDNFCRAVKSSFTDPDEFVPYFYTETKDGRVLMIPASAPNHYSKDEVLMTAQMILAYVKADFYFSVNDTWMVVKNDINDMPQGSIEHEPGRVEALVITGVTNDSAVAKAFGYEYDKDNKIKWTETHDMTEQGSVAGRYTELLRDNDTILDGMPSGAASLLDKLVKQFTLA